MHYAHKKVLITGGLGLIGSHLARRLVAMGAQVTILDALLPGHGGNLFNIRDIQSQVALHLRDIRDPLALDGCIPGQEIVFNLAGQTGHLASMLDPQSDFEINVSGQYLLLETCRRLNPTLRIVFSSTRQIHGRPRYLPLNEDHPVQPMDFNGIHKATGEYYHQLYQRVYGLEVTILRLTNTYGPGMRIMDAGQSFLGHWIRLLLEGVPLPIFGDGGQLRDFNHVDDCVEALLLAGSRPEAVGKVYLLGGSEVVSLLELARRLSGFTSRGGYALIPFPGERKRIDIGSCYGDFSAIANELGWRPKMDLNQGLQMTVDYYGAYSHHYLQRRT
ncbi:MAG: NAD-dependent epimerase/dehydratase family protein [Magnetococcales bacterium]|nr:NAD-dependent epimerase/dehydratase family protein [Magnetococcales bacterium]